MFYRGMELNEQQYEKTAKHLPRQRGNVSMVNLLLVNCDTACGLHSYGSVE